ncbi:LacI family DNA-binding transcriptional regulator [Thermus filiformis]|uniref:LacI family transcriptional regulator n=1 Tax=Thermus filiformis TaxID=276 RepID=A0A0A2WSR1_THEFI|nr:LacI family DNA-binding transcriptional regulator [Thermus filiformis]KGQ21350.2 LacI family transcriptional regulator [Thermus filiformis]
MSKPKAPTIREIARIANVSVGTVSRALNGRPGVSQKTRERVMEAVRTLGYAPNPVARELVGKPSTVGLLLAPGVRRHTPYFVLLLEALAEELWRMGLRVKEAPTDPQGLPLEEARGYVLLGAHDHDPRIEALREAGKPFVLIGVYPGVFWVAPDDVAGGYLATRHLLELGHEEIALLTGYLHHQAGRERLLGYRKALLEAGLPFRPEMVLDGRFDPLSAYRAVRRAWEEGLRFTAIFAASDEMALGAQAALEDLGLRVPEEVSLVGYDDLPEVGEGLTTVHQDLPTLAREAADLLEGALAGEEPRGRRVPVHLVPRGTTARRGVGG